MVPGAQRQHRGDTGDAPRGPSQSRCCNRSCGEDLRIDKSRGKGSFIRTMYFDAAVAAFQQIFTPAFRRVFLKTLALTFLLLIGFFIGAEKLFAAWLVLPYAWLTTVLSV